MEVLAAITNLIVAVMDYPLGWLLALPRDVAIVLLAIGTSLLLTLVRRWTTNQDQLRRSKGDLRRLKQLLRERKRAKDKAAVVATRTSLGMVNAIRLKAEGKPLLVSLLPIILLAVWAVERLDYFPPRVGEDLIVKAYYPLSSVDQLTHLVPPAGVEMQSPAVQLVEVDPHGQQNGLATWVLRPIAPLAADLLIRHQGETAVHPVRVGGRVYAPPLCAGSGNRILATETVLRQARFLGIVPGVPALALPPWLIAYLIIVIPFVPILRRVLRVY
ncbi:MAG TPA: hypothetical protein PLE19_19940 [Planctomycetota bacterium]|mgnify:FL=1|nr:hypothetical protein [Planctomycetota bacterium]HRR81776.1 hypothetical protein [Planctomycetota bacterium]HRT95341.1 hypothetical protein [Planctomycetota bacterium]